jgi:hypothetical protein
VGAFGSRTSFLTLRVSLLAAAALVVLVVLANSLNTSLLFESRPGRTLDADFAGFSAPAPIDAHAHLYKDDPTFRANLSGPLVALLQTRSAAHRGAV